MRGATGNTRHCRISGAVSSVRRTTSSMRDDRQHAAGNAMHGMRDETKGSRTLAHLGVASGSLRRPSWRWIIGIRGVGTPSLLPAVLRIPECIPCELRASHGSTAAPLSSAASSSASEASANASNRAAPSVSSSAPSVSEAELSGRTRCRLLAYGR
jgi:hypothetical protein